ncbi:MAG: hypothetical protein PHY92_02415 [Alphaproteobacteria bacterium]|nr:hypothetical protein [Alphaproteobacteria bacterium]
MSRRVLGITYINAHKALYLGSLGVARRLRRVGYEAEVFDAAPPGALEELKRRLQTEEFAFCFGLQGVGSRLEMQGQNLWTARRTPFLCLHFDNPCCNIFNHFCSSPHVANLYHFESFLEMQKRYIRSPQISGLLPNEIVHKPEQPLIPWRSRPIKLLFMKSGETVDEAVHTLNSLPSRLRDGVWQQIERAGKEPNLLLPDLVNDLFRQLNIDRDSSFDLFWGIQHWMDNFLRRKRAIDFVNWLKFQEGAMIVGNGWDFIDRTGAKAVFRSSINMGQARMIYSNARFVCNTNPYGSDIVHERVISGLIVGCHVLNDANAWWQAHFGDLSCMTLFDWDKPLEDQLGPVIADVQKASDAWRTGEGRARVVEKLYGQSWVGKIEDYVQQVRAFAGA